MSGIDQNTKDYATEKMVRHLSVLRTMLHYSQDDLAERIGVGRQTIVGIETRKRNLTWSVYLSLLFVFLNHSETKPLIDVFDIFPSVLREYYNC